MTEPEIGIVKTAKIVQSMDGSFAMLELDGKPFPWLTDGVTLTRGESTTTLDIRVPVSVDSYRKDVTTEAVTLEEFNRRYSKLLRRKPTPPREWTLATEALRNELTAEPEPKVGDVLRMTPPPEPPYGTVVLDQHNRAWQRSMSEMWSCARAGRSYTWSALMSFAGEHGVTVVYAPQPTDAV